LAKNKGDTDLQFYLQYVNIFAKASQDNLFHTLLGMMEIETSVYDKDMDILYNSKEKEF
jgi:glucan phosphoethanolaminetransferase (alkaline phosphatase superfamily)